MPLAERVSWGYALNRSIAVLFLIFATIALLLLRWAVSVIAHSVSRRTQEIGIRMAIGATADDIRRLVLMQGMLPLGIGLTIGLVASFAVNRVLKSELVQVSPSDPITLVVAFGSVDFGGHARLSDSGAPRDAGGSRCRSETWVKSARLS